MVVVVHVGGIFSIGAKTRCDQFGRDLNVYEPIKNLGELRLYAGVRFARERAAGTITFSQDIVRRNSVGKFGATRNKDIPTVERLKLDEFDAFEPDVCVPFRFLVGHLMWLANQTRPNIVNAVRTVSRYSPCAEVGALAGGVAYLDEWVLAHVPTNYGRSTVNFENV